MYFVGFTVSFQWKGEVIAPIHCFIPFKKYIYRYIRNNFVLILYKPLFSRTVIFAFLDFCGNSRVVNFAIFLMLSLL